jgi:hypothetical protein
MNWNKFTALMVLLSVLVAVITAVEIPRKPKQDKIYVLPRVEDMASVPNPLQF